MVFSDTESDTEIYHANSLKTPKSEQLKIETTNDFTCAFNT